MAANRRNAAKSTGPRTDEGKAASRRNALTHGLTGAGVVMSPVDRVEVERRTMEFQREVAGHGSALAAGTLARRAAVLAVRLERSATQEFAATRLRMREAVSEFDEVRQEEADRLFEAVADDPTARENLLAMPEGVDRVLGVLRGLRPCAEESDWGEAEEQDWDRWVAEDGVDRVAGIDREIARLEAHRRTLNLEWLATLRTEAANRALVGDEPSTLRARKYEAATERAFFRTLREIREFRQGETPPAPPASSAPAVAATAARDLARLEAEVARQKAAPPKPKPPVGSFCPDEARPPETVPTTAKPTDQSPAHGQSRYPDRKRRPKLR